MSDLSSITDRLNAATPVPWRVNSHGDDWHDVESDDRLVSQYSDRKDAEFIAAAPTDIAFLLAQLKALEESRDMYKLNYEAAERAVTEYRSKWTTQRDAVLAIHGKVTTGRRDAEQRPVFYRYCAECSDPETGMTISWPCATVLALGGETE